MVTIPTTFAHRRSGVGIPYELGLFLFGVKLPGAKHLYLGDGTTDTETTLYVCEDEPIRERCLETRKVISMIVVQLPFLLSRSYNWLFNQTR